MLIRALDGLSKLKLRTGYLDQAEAVQLRLIGTLRASRGMDSISTIEACRGLGWMYEMNERFGDAKGVLVRTLELAENSSSVRGETRIQLVSALCEDLSTLHRKLRQYQRALSYAEKAVRTLEQGELGRSNPRCGVLWTAITSDWAVIEGMSSGQLKEVYFAAKEAMRVASKTFPAHSDHFEADAWQCAAHSNFLAVLLAKDDVKSAEDHLSKAVVFCPHLKEEGYLEKLTGAALDGERTSFFIQPKLERKAK